LTISSTVTPEPSPLPAPTAKVGRGSSLGIAMGGGGARAAYQVGFLRCLARRFPDLEIPYVTGVSAGAINAAHLAAHHGTFSQSVEELTGLWSNLRIEDVFRVGAGSLTSNVARWGLRVATGMGRSKAESSLKALVDTAPLRRFLSEALHAVEGEITGINYNLNAGRLKAVALTTTDYNTGRSVTWIQGQDIDAWERPNRTARHATLTVEHVMASAALPLFFPAVRIGSNWYGDGGLRLSAPLSPVLHLGATRIMAISTRYDRSIREAEQPVVRGYPPPVQVLGVMMNSVFLDLLDQDAWRLERMNRVLLKIREEEREGLRPIKLLVLRPSVDLGQLANQFEPQLPRAFRFLTRNLGSRQTQSPDSLSLLMFQPDFLQRLIAIGEQDAEARADEIEEFITGDGYEDA
jgi:NTE family protein